MGGLLNLLLTQVLVYGYPMLIAIITLGYFGLPIPAEVILLAAGALSADGSLNIFLVIGLVTTTTILGDSFGYYLGKKFGKKVIQKIGFRFHLTEDRAKSLDKLLLKWGVWGIFITRWLLTPLGIPVNLIAGISSYPFKKFIIFAALGEFFWAFLFVYLGYLFGENWVTLIDYVAGAPEVMVLTLLGTGLLFIGINVLTKR